METLEELKQRVQREKQLAARLQMASARLEAAQQERIWAIVAANEAGLSIRQIAVATGLSPSRIHQLLQAPESKNIPVWLSQFHEPTWSVEECAPIPVQAPIDALLTAEVEALRWCINWLERLARGEEVVVNLRPDSDSKTEFVRFEHSQVLRVLSRIAADLDALTHLPNEVKSIAGEAVSTQHRRRLAVPEPEPPRRSQREERNALRAAAGLPPYSG